MTQEHGRSPTGPGCQPSASAAAASSQSGILNAKQYTCDLCGCDTPAYWTRCFSCRLQRKLLAATEVQDEGGPYFEFGGDRYYHDLETAAEDGVKWVCPCKVTYPRLNAESVLENLLDDMPEDASIDDLDATEQFRAAVDAFNAAQTTRSFWADETRKISVPASAIEARRAETPSGSLADEGAGPQDDAHE